MSALQPIKPGDRVEYYGVTDVPTTRTIRPSDYVVVGYGTVLDVFRGEAGVVEQIFSKPDGEQVDFRVDFRGIPGARIVTIAPIGTGV